MVIEKSSIDLYMYIEKYLLIQATVSGWGTLVAGGKQPDVLQEVNVDTMTNTEVKCVNSLLTCNYLQYLDHWYYIT